MVMLLILGLLLADGPAATSRPAARPQSTAPAARPLDAYPAFVRPLLKYGVGAAVAAWFLFGIGWLCWKKLRHAHSPEQRRAARLWVAGMLLGVGLALLIVAIGLVLWLRNQHLAMLFVAGPAAVLLPPLCARWLEGKDRTIAKPTATKTDVS